MRLTIRKKLIGMTLFLLIIPILAIGVVSYEVSVRETDALIEANLKNNVKLAIELTKELESSASRGLMTVEEAQEKVRERLLGPRLPNGDRAINPELELGQHGYFFILNDKGLLLAHPKEENKNIWDKQSSDGVYYIQELIQASQRGGGAVYYEWPLPDNGKEALKISYAEQAPAWGWIISAGSYMQDYNQGQQRILTSIALTLGICVAVGIVVLTLFSRHIAGPIRKLTVAAGVMAQGDLREQPLTVRNRDELGELVVSFRSLGDKLRSLVGEVTGGAGQLSEATARQSTSTDETVAAARHTSSLLLEMADRGEAQVRSISEASRAVEEMAIGIGRIAATSMHAFESSGATLAAAENGHVLVKDSSHRIHSVHETVTELAALVSTLGEQSSQIGEIAGTMRELSAQTHLLALNASIEAARAGEQGQGFSVVAGEIRKLADRSDEAARQVAEMTEKIVSDIGGAVRTMETGSREVEASVSAMQETGEAFERVLTATRQVVAQVEEASAAAEQLSAGSEQISASLQEMETQVKHTAAASQTISSTTEEQLAAMEELSASADKLNQLADRMRNAAGKFTL